MQLNCAWDIFLKSDTKAKIKYGNPGRDEKIMFAPVLNVL